MKVKSLSRVRLFATPWTAADQAPPSMGFSRQEYWSGLPLPSPWTLLYTFINLIELIMYFFFSVLNYPCILGKVIFVHNVNERIILFIYFCIWFDRLKSLHLCIHDYEKGYIVFISCNVIFWFW